MKDFPEVYEKSKLDEMYAALNFPDEKLKLLKDYFSALREFYRIISLREAFNIIKRQNGDLISEKNFIDFSEIACHDGGFFYCIAGKDMLYEDVADVEFMDMEIIADYLLDFDFEDYYAVAEAQKDKPMYVPEKEELLKYADDMYFEHNRYTKALCDFFTDKLNMTDEKADDMAGECVLGITCAIYPNENPVEDVLDNFARMRIKFTKLQQSEFVRLVCDLANNTRHCCNRGFTPNELAERFGIIESKTVSGISATNGEKSFSPSEIGFIGIAPRLVMSGQKIGRNDPCPCGSGKKYKKCCGR